MVDHQRNDIQNQKGSTFWGFSTNQKGSTSSKQKYGFQYGYMKFELTSLSIPEMQDTSAAGKRPSYKLSGAGNTSDQLKVNETFMIRIKIGTESNTIFVATPDRILDQVHKSMTANIDSINEKVYFEFYDVLNE